MKKSDRSFEEILADVLSKDEHRVWSGACNIISLGQDPERIAPFIPHLDEIRESTTGVPLGGAVAPNKRFVDLTLKIIEFHKRGTDCPCRLYPLSGEDSIYNPKEQAEQGNVSIIETLHGGNSNFAEYSYIAECSRCKRRYKITEKLYHFVCWKWYSI